MENNKVVLMAVAAGRENDKPVEGGSFPKYIGLFPCNIVGINPTKAELDKLYGSNDKPADFKEPVYVTTDEAGVRSVRIEFIFKTVKELCDKEMLVRKSYFIKDAPQMNSDKTKVKVCNIYGEFTWIPVENMKNKTVPDNMKWFDTEGLRAAYQGEEAVVNLIKNFMAIPAKAFRKEDGEWQYIENKSDAWCQLDEVKSYFNNNVSEIGKLLKSKPNNIVVPLFGVRTTDDNKSYQDIFGEYIPRYSTMKSSVMPYKLRPNIIKHLKDQLDKRKLNGGYPNTEFGESPFEPTEFKEGAPSDVESIAAEPVGEAPSPDWFNAE